MIIITTVFSPNSLRVPSKKPSPVTKTNGSGNLPAGMQSVRLSPQLPGQLLHVIPTYAAALSGDAGYLVTGPLNADKSVV